MRTAAARSQRKLSNIWLNTAWKCDIAFDFLSWIFFGRWTLTGGWSVYCIKRRFINWVDAAFLSRMLLRKWNGPKCLLHKSDCFCWMLLHSSLARRYTIIDEFSSSLVCLTNRCKLCSVLHVLLVEHERREKKKKSQIKFCNENNFVEFCWEISRGAVAWENVAKA